MVTNFKNITIEEACINIKNKREENKKIFDENYEKANKLIDLGKYKEAEKLTSKDVLGYYHIYAKAENEEKLGNLEEAAKLYWKNIYLNGSDAPANFKRLLIIFKKLDQLEDELKLAKIYLNFVSKSDYPKIEKKN